MAIGALDTTTPNRRCLGIRTKIVLPLAGMALVVSLFVALVVHRAQKQQHDRQCAERVSFLARSIARLAESAGAPSQLQRLVAATAGEPGVQWIVVAAGDPPRVVASSRPAWLGLPAGELPHVSPPLWCPPPTAAMRCDGVGMRHERDGVLDYVVPLPASAGPTGGLAAPSGEASSGEAFSGTLLLRVDESRIWDVPSATTARLLAAVGAMFALMWVAAEVVLRRVVLRPVQAITQVARRTALGERTVRVRSARTDELGQLGAKFDRMLDELTHREECEREAARLAFQARQEAEAALAEVRCHKFALDQHAIVAVTDPTGIITYVNDRFCEISKYARDELIGQDHRIMNSGHHPREFWREMWRTVSHGQVWHAEVCNQAKDGSLYWVDTTIVPFKDSQGRITQHVAIRSDITRLKQAEEDLTRAARLDKLTGLPNRGLFLDRLQHAIARVQRSPDHTYAVMFLDFDRFKIINDSLGHSVGDALLVGIAERLRNHVRAVDSVSSNTEGHTSARLGGDEFVVLLDDIQTPAEAATVADRLLEALSQPYCLGKHEVYSTASIGIVMGELTYERAEDVVRDADTAMYESKRLGRCRYTMFDASMRERVQRHQRLESELRKAIGTSQLSLTYQPIVSLSTGAFVSVEALLRWRHPADGNVDPSEFVAIAEESDLILTLGEWALREACRQFVRWQEELGGLAPRKVSINVSKRQFDMPSFPQVVERVLYETGIPSAHVQLELTEDAFVSDIRAAVVAMRAIKALGIELAIDDFGTGTSSFASLHEFPVDVLKIHRSMLNGIEDSKDVASLIHGLAVMVKNMGIDMVAEGVETPAQVIALQELGCDYAQGFFFAKPLTPDEVRAFASRNLSLTCNTRGAAAYANQWNERLTVFHAMEHTSGTP